MGSNPSYWFSVVVITYNEEQNIGNCLSSVVGLSDDIIVVDSLSTDNTIAIADGFGARCFQRAFTNFGDQKNWANEKAKYDYILSLDADEVLSKELIQGIQSIEAPYALSYSMNRLSNYCGRWVKHSGWYPDWKTRLFNRNHISWESVAVHEQLMLPEGGNAVALKGNLLHYTFRTEEAHQKQVVKFNKLKAEQLFKRGKQSGGLIERIRPTLKFLKIYLLKRGYLDGETGLKIARNSAIGERIKWQYLRQLYQQKQKRS